MCATIGCVPHTLLMRDEHAVFFIKHGKQKFIFNSEFFRVIQSLSQKKKKNGRKLATNGMAGVWMKHFVLPVVQTCSEVRFLFKLSLLILHKLLQTESTLNIG